MDPSILPQIYMGNSAENGKNLVVTDDLLIRFLLGELGDAERIQVAGRSFLDDDLFDRLLEAENDLVDRYVKGELTSRERELFEQGVLHREPIRQKVAFARSLEAALAGRGGVTLGQASAVQTEAALHHPRPNRLWYGLAVAAAIVVTIVGTVWIVRRSQAPPRHTDLALDRQGAESVHASPGASPALSQDIQQPPAPGPTSPQSTDRPGTTQESQPSPAQAIGTFVLLPGATRSGEGPQMLTIGPALRSVRLQLQLDGTDEYPAYDVILRTAGGSIVSKRTRLSRRAHPGGGAVTLELSAERLAPGEYEVELNGRRAASPATLVNYYYFAIAKAR